MDHGLELISPILEIVDRAIHISVLSWKWWIVRSIISPILEIVDRTIHIISFLQVVYSPGEQGGGPGGDGPQ